MKKYELSYDKDDEIVKIIKNIILSRYLILEDRMDVLFKNPRPAMDINLYFYKDGNDNDFTEIMFTDGTENSKCSMPERISINGLISFQTITNLIYFILSDHDYIKDIYKNVSEFKLSFDINLNDDNIHGVSCGTIGLRLDFSSYPSHEELLNNYIKIIINNFYNELKYTENFKREYNKYCSLTKEKIINSLSEDDLHLFTHLLNYEELCNILLNIPNDRFIELYDEFENKKRNEEKILIK